MPNQFTIYKSTDGSAPALSGTAGSLVALLDAILVNGYGSKAAAGWGKAFTGTNKAAYRPASGARLYVRVQDDAPGAGGARDARCVGYEVMTDVDTGTGLFPTAAQAANGVFCRKSTTADSTARVWVCFADAVTFYLFVATGDRATQYHQLFFGEFYSLVTSDAYRCFISGNTTETASATNANPSDRLDTDQSAISGTSGFYIARGHTGTGGAVAAGRVGNRSFNANATYLNGTLPYTNPADGGLYLSPVWIFDPVTAPTLGIRGRLRGLWHFCHVSTSVADGDTVTGTGDLAGKTLYFLKHGCSGGGALATVFTMETSATLETN